MVSGLTGSERRSLLEWPDGTPLFEHFRDLPRPLRIPDLVACAAALGISANPSRVTALLGTPIMHRGVRVGYFFLGRKEGARPFTDEDEEILVCSSRRRRRRSPTPGRTAPTSRTSSTPRLWASWSSRPGRAGRCCSTGRHGGLREFWVRRKTPPSGCWRS